MCKVISITALLLGCLFTNITFADTLVDKVTAQDIWLQDTANTRATVETLQNQANVQQAQQQNLQMQQQQQIQQTLNSILEQQKAMLLNSQPATTTSTFQAQPNAVTGGSNPWSKPNPWQNTQQNLYKGQQYTPTPATNTAPAANTSNQIYVTPSNTGPSSTVSNSTTPPTTNAGATPASTQQNSNSVNIYK